LTWKPVNSYFLLAAVCFLAAAGSALIDSLGPPLIFAFATLCSVFLAFGALEAKGGDRGGERGGPGGAS
jgi:hypothetical protein